MHDCTTTDRELALYRKLLDLVSSEAPHYALLEVLELLSSLARAELMVLKPGGDGASLVVGAGPTPSREALEARIARARRECLDTARWQPLEPHDTGYLYVEGTTPLCFETRRLVERCALQLGIALSTAVNIRPPRPLQNAVREFQQRHILAALERTDWNMVTTARELGVARSHLYRLVSSLHLHEHRH